LKCAVTGKGWFVKGRSGNPGGRPKNLPEFAPNTDDPAGADRRIVGNLVIEARKFSGLAVDTLVELTKDDHTDSTRFAAATALLDRGYGRPAQSLDLHLSADAITKRLSDMSDAELAALEQRMIAAAPMVLEATAEVSDDAGDVEDS
jgi:predicted component of type VI protein secretion system